MKDFFPHVAMSGPLFLKVIVIGDSKYAYNHLLITL